MGLSQEQIKQLMGPSTPTITKPLPRHVHDPLNDNNVPRCSRVKWLEEKNVCKPGECGSTAFIRVDDKPLCLKHAFDELVRIIANLESLPGQL